MITIINIAVVVAAVVKITLHLCKLIQEKRIKTKNRSALHDNINKWQVKHSVKVEYRLKQKKICK